MIRLRCTICGRSVDMDSLAEVAEERYGLPPGVTMGKRQLDEYKSVYARVVDEFDHTGCEALGIPHLEEAA